MTSSTGSGISQSALNTARQALLSSASMRSAQARINALLSEHVAFRESSSIRMARTAMEARDRMLQPQPVIQQAMAALRQYQRVTGMPLDSRGVAAARRAVTSMARQQDGVRAMLDALDTQGLISPEVRDAASVAAARAIAGDYDTDTVDTDLPEVPEGFFDDFEEVARNFAAAEVSGQSWLAQRETFRLFMVAIIFIMIMHALVQSDMAKELIEDSTMAGSLAVLLVGHAGKAWDRVFPRPAGEGDDPEGDGS